MSLWKPSFEHLPMAPFLLSTIDQTATESSTEIYLSFFLNIYLYFCVCVGGYTHAYSGQGTTLVTQFFPSTMGVPG